MATGLTSQHLTRSIDMKQLHIETIKEKGWGFSDDRLLMLEANRCDFCAQVTDCASFDCASKEYGTVDICEPCIRRAFRDFNEFKMGDVGG